jgi:hypothetical protein
VFRRAYQMLRAAGLMRNELRRPPATDWRHSGLRFADEQRVATRIAGIAPGIYAAAHHYATYYDEVFSRTLRAGKKIILGDKEKPRRCRFCQKQEPEIRFSDDSHAVSRLTGNNVLFLDDECNQCNSRFSFIEDDLGKYTLPYRVLGQVRGYRGVPWHKWSETARIDMQDTGLHIQHREDEYVVQTDRDRRELRFVFKLQKYRPLAVYKALLKMALSVMPNERLADFRQALTWLASEDVLPNAISDGTRFLVIHTFTSGPLPYRDPFVSLYIRKNDALVPYATMMLGFGNITFQIFLPCPDKDAHLVDRR